MSKNLLNLNKKFRNWTEKSLRVFANFEIPMFYVYINEHYMSISHMAVSGYGTNVMKKVYHYKSYWKYIFNKKMIFQRKIKYSASWNICQFL